MLRIELAEIRAMQSLARDLDIESCAVGLVVPSGSPQHFIVRELQAVPEAAYLRRTPSAATLKPEFCIELSNRARKAGAGALFAHTHPGEHPFEGFSPVDDAGESQLAQYFQRRSEGRTHFAAVFTAGDVRARVLGDSRPVPVVGVGRTLELPAVEAGATPIQHDRQVRAFGTAGQHLLAQVVVAIVGLGGTGSVVAQQLAHLGVRNFLLIDPDQVEVTNLNRLVGSGPDDVGRAKVEVAARSIHSISPEAICELLARDVVDEDVASTLVQVDVIFGCTDSMASRAVMNQLAYQYLVPCIDMGVGIHVTQSRVNYVTGRVQMLSPGLPCLVCTDKLDADLVRRELMTEEQRRQDPYIIGDSLPQPAVVSLNSTVASAAVTMFLGALVGIPSEARMLVYDGIRGSLRPAAMEPRPHCIVCSYDGALAQGERWRLPVRSHPGV